MKSLSRARIILLVVVFFICSFSFSQPVGAEGAAYQSNGQAGFYGKYEYDEKNDEPEKHSEANQLLPGSNSYSSSGKPILPRTGDSTHPIFFLVGIITLVGMMVFIYQCMNNRKKGEWSL